MKISIVGVGLIGGSMALKLKERGIVKYVYGVDNTTAHLKDALALKIIDKAVTLDEGIRNADVIVLT